MNTTLPILASALVLAHAPLTIPGGDEQPPAQAAAWQQHCEAQSYSYVFMDYAPRAVLLYARDRIHLVEFHDRSIIVEPRGSIVGYSRDRTPEDDAFYAYLMSLTPEKKK